MAYANFDDALKALREKPAEPAAPVTRKAAPNHKGRTPGRLFGTAGPYVTTGHLGDDAGVNVCKAAAFAGGMIRADDCKAEIDLSDRLRAVYGGFGYFSNSPGSILVPTSAAYLPTTAANGCEIPGAAAIKKEVAQRLLTVKGVDPDELAAKAARGSDLATKALNTLSDLAGGSLVPPASLGDMIDLQRNLEVFSRLGATSITLPSNGMIDFPKLTGASTAYWVGEAQNVTESQPTTGTLSLRAKKLAVRVPYTYELLKFADTSVEQMVRMDMTRQAALKADLAMLQGTGGLQVKGLITYDTQSSWAQGTDKVLAYTVTSNLIQPEDVTTILAGLPDGVEATGWVFHPSLFAKLRNRRADAVSAADGKGPFVFDITRSGSDGKPAQPRLADVPVVTSRQVSTTRGSGAQTYALAGFFPDWVIGRIGVMEFMTDPYTLMQSMQTVLQAVQFVDAGPRHQASFVFADAINVA